MRLTLEQAEKIVNLVADELVVGYFESDLSSLIPVTISQIMKTHQIPKARSRRIAAWLTGLTNRSTGVTIMRIVPQTNFELNFCSLTPLFPPSAVRRLPRELQGLLRSIADR